MLEIKNLHVAVEDKEILKGIDLHVERRAKCTPSWGPTAPARARSRARWPAIRNTRSPAARSCSTARTCSTMDPEERAREGVFMAFQYPVEIPGVNNAYFLKAALNAMRKHRGQPELDAMEFMKLVQGEVEAARHRPDDAQPRRSTKASRAARRSATRSSRWRVLEPKLAILDETDSGLDIDALKIVADGVNAMRSARPRDHRRHPLPAAAQLHRARLRARAERRPDRPVGRQGAGARARGQGLRLDRSRRAAAEHEP